MGISWWNHKKLKQDSVPNFLDVVRLFPAPGPWSSLAPIGIKRLSSSSELGAQHVSPHQIPKRPHLQEKDMPVAFICSCHVSCQKLKLQVQKKKFLTVRSGFTWKSAIHEDLKRPLRPQDISKWLTNRKADCCTLLKRITKLKCVNSEFKSVDIHPKQGCLNWPYGTMSESP